MTPADPGSSSTGDATAFGLEPMAGGYSGETFLAHTEAGDEVVRVYGRQPQRCMVDAALLRLLTGLVPVATVRDLRPPTDHDPGVLVTSRLPGMPLDLVLPRLDESRAGLLGVGLGRLLARLSGIPQLRFGFFTGAHLTVTSEPDVPDSLRAWAESQARTGLLSQWAAADWFSLLELLDRSDDLLGAARPSRYVLVHGDFNPKNILVDPTTLDVTGLVDWEFAHAGSPYADLGNLTRFERRPEFVASVVEALVANAPPVATDVLELGRAADLWAVLELAGREQPNAVSQLANQLLLAQARAGDLAAWPWRAARVDPAVDSHVSW